jgi:hypothetical protein
MTHISVDDLVEIFNGAENPTSAVRLIVPYYQPGVVNSESNTFIVNKTAQHFRNNNKADGMYKLGHGLELILGEDSKIWEEPPF